jgi:hypothetical protein
LADVPVCFAPALLSETASSNLRNVMASSGFYLDEFSARMRYANAVLDDERLDQVRAGILGALPATHRAIVAVIEIASEPVIVRRFAPRIRYLPLDLERRRRIRLRPEPETVSLTDRAIIR